MLSCITLERQQLDVYPVPLTPPPPFSQLLCLALLCIIPDENIICLLSVCLSHTNPKPQKWQLSYTGIMLPPPSTHSPFNQERLITRDLDWHSFVTAHLRDGLMERSNWGMTERKGRESKKKRERRGDNIVKQPMMTAEYCGRENFETSSFHHCYRP